MPIPPGDAAVPVLRGRHHPLLKRLRALKQRHGTRQEMLLLEGPKLLDEALAAGVEIVETVWAESAALAGRHTPLLERLSDAGGAPRLVDDTWLAALSETETSQGVLALARRPHFDAARLAAAGPAPLLVACGVQDPGNLGGLLRSAEAAGAAGALLLQGCADAWSWKALRGSMGSAFRLPHLSGLSWEQALATVRAQGRRLLAAVPPRADRPALPYWDADWRGPLALLVGGEGAGLPAAAEAAADACVVVPLAGRVESLNVGVAAGLLLFEVARRRAADGRAAPPR